MHSYAGFWKRLLAALIDVIFVIIINLTISLSLQYLHRGTPTGNTQVSFSFLRIWSIVFPWLYFGLMESSLQQATLGKQALGIIVTDIYGQKISFLRATKRHFAKIISVVILLSGYIIAVLTGIDFVRIIPGLILLISYIIAAFTEKKQTLHDLMAGTLVVNRGGVSAKALGATILMVGLGVIFIMKLAPLSYSPAFQRQLAKAKQSEAKQYVSSINRAEQAYFLNNGKFASNLQELGIAINPDSKIYSYKITVLAPKRAVISTANALEPGMKSYKGAVFAAGAKGGTQTRLCEGERQFEPLPDIPQRVEDEVQCLPGSYEVAR